MQRVVLFDDGLGTLAPLTCLRASFDVRVGALTLAERAGHPGAASSLVGLRCPDALAAVTRERHTVPVNTPPDSADPLLFMNGRCPVPPAGMEGLGPGAAIADAEAGIVALRGEYAWAGEVLDGKAKPRIAGQVTGCLMTRPWHARTFRDRCLAIDLAILEDPGRAPPPGSVVFGQHALSISPTARVYPGVTFDLEHGPIVVGDRATIRPGAILVGPCYVGPGSTVLERATIRQNTAIGPSCKVNGEIGGTVFQGFSNKAHDGYLGDSWVGEWVNLGAGTTNSNLLNTYGEVFARAAPEAGNERTGEQFLGAVIGDHVKTAIGTRLMTGCVLGTGGMFATTAPVSGATPPFAWATDAGTRRYRLDKFMEVMRAAMERRKVSPSEAYRNRVSELHARSV